MTHNICSGCGLPSELCVCTAIEKVEQKLKIFVEKRKFRKPTTVIEGVTDNAKDIVKRLKTKLACGGTLKGNHIELQGDHRAKLKDMLKKLGYKEDQIEIS